MTGEAISLLSHEERMRRFEPKPSRICVQHELHFRYSEGEHMSDVERKKASKIKHVRAKEGTLKQRHMQDT